MGPFDQLQDLESTHGIPVALWQYIGMREEQEDTIRVLRFPVSNAFVVVVADGMGGHDDGREASLSVATAFMYALEEADHLRSTTHEPFYSPAEMHRLLQSALLEANDALARKKAQGRIGANAGCTFTAVACYQEQSSQDSWIADCISVGDSYIYHYSPERATVKLVNELHTLRHQLLKQGGSLADYDQRKLAALVSAVSGKTLKAISHPNPFRISANDLFILSSDGLDTFSVSSRHEYPEESLRLTLQDFLNEHPDYTRQQIVSSLIGRVISIVEKGHANRQDNTSVAVVRLAAENVISRSCRRFLERRSLILTLVAVFLLTSLSIFAYYQWFADDPTPTPKLPAKEKVVSKKTNAETASTQSKKGSPNEVTKNVTSDHKLDSSASEAPDKNKETKEKESRKEASESDDSEKLLAKINAADGIKSLRSVLLSPTEITEPKIKEAIRSKLMELLSVSAAKDSNVNWDDRCKSLGDKKVYDFSCYVNDEKLLSHLVDEWKGIWQESDHVPLEEKWKKLTGVIIPMIQSDAFSDSIPILPDCVYLNRDYAFDGSENVLAVEKIAVVMTMNNEKQTGIWVRISADEFRVVRQDVEGEARFFLFHPGSSETKSLKKINK